MKLIGDPHGIKQEIIPYFGIALVQLCAILLGMRFIFGVPIHGSVLLLIVLTLPYIFTCLAIGILISSKAQSQPEALQLAFMIVLPSIFFSGYIFPRETIDFATLNWPHLIV